VSGHGSFAVWRALGALDLFLAHSCAPTPPSKDPMKTLLAALPLALLIACSGGGAAKTSALDLPKLGLKADAPEGSTVNDAIMGTGHMVMGPGLVANVAEASDSQPKTIEDAKKEAEMFTPKNLKEEKLADGWVVTFDNEGGMGKNFFAQVRRDIGGKAIWCETTASQVEQQTNAVNFCKSLKK
jgi:hypothetical protein